MEEKPQILPKPAVPEKHEPGNGYAGSMGKGVTTMAEAYKCDVESCNQLVEGSPAAKVVLTDEAVSKALCPLHKEQIVSALFPSLLKKEEVAPAAPDAAAPANEQ